MTLKTTLLQIKTTLLSSPATNWLIQHRRLSFPLLGAVLLAALALFILPKIRPTPLPPYVATYQVDTQLTSGDTFHSRNEKVVISHLDNRYKSEVFVNDLALLSTTYNNPNGYFFCAYNATQDFDCQRLGDALTKDVSRPPKIDGLQISPTTPQTIDISGQTRSCQETTYTLAAATDPNATIQELTATVCLDEQLKIPLIANLKIRYRVDDITEIKEMVVEQTRTLTELNLTPNLTEADFSSPGQ